jgi:hypothetical protein
LAGIGRAQRVVALRARHRGQLAEQGIAPQLAAVAHATPARRAGCGLTCPSTCLRIQATGMW